MVKNGHAGFQTLCSDSSGYKSYYRNDLLDNMGMNYYNGMDIEAVGQFRKFGALWLQLLAGEAARLAGDLWVPQVRAPLDQLLGQAVPYPLWIKALWSPPECCLGFAGKVPPESAKLHWEIYHNPRIPLEYQSKDVLTKLDALLKRSSPATRDGQLPKRVRSVSLFRLQSPGLARRGLMGYFLLDGYPYSSWVASSSGGEISNRSCAPGARSCPLSRAVASIGSFHPHALSVRCHRLDGQI